MQATLCRICGCPCWTGLFHEVDSSELAFKIAGSMALKNAVKKAGPIMLEPIMDVESVCPVDYVGDVISDLSSRRGKVLGMDTRSDVRVVAAQVPLARDVRLRNIDTLTHPGPRTFTMAGIAL